MNHHEARIAELEVLSPDYLRHKIRSSSHRRDGDVADDVGDTVLDAGSPSLRFDVAAQLRHPVSPQQSSALPTPQPSKPFMDTLELEAPIATLRSLGALSGDHSSDHSLAFRSPDHMSGFDPISRNILTATDARRAFDM